MTTLNQQQEQLRQGTKSDVSSVPPGVPQQPTQEQLLSSSNLPGGPITPATDNTSGMKPSVTPKETATPQSEKQGGGAEQLKGSSASTTLTTKPQTTTMIGNNGEKIVVGDDFIQITYDNKNIDSSAATSTSGSSSGEKKDVGVGDVANLVLDGEASATLAEATSEIAAASSDASTQLSLGDGGQPLLMNINEIPSTVNDEEKSLLQRLIKLNNEVNERTSSMERLTKKLADHIIRLISLSWNTNRAPTMVSLPFFGLSGIEEVMEQNISMASKYSLLTGANAARTMCDKMESEAKSTREWLMLQLGDLSSFTSSSNEVVRQRGNEFKKKLEALIQTCDRIMNRAKHAAASFTHFLNRRVSLPSIEQVTKPSLTSGKEGKEAVSSPAVPSTEDTKRTAMTTQAAAPVAAPTPMEKVRVRWSPDFLSRELLDGVLITSTLPGLTSDNLTINVDEQKRILHISGQRTVKQRVIDHEATAAQQPEDDDDIADLFDFGFGLFGRRRHRAGRLVPQQEAVTKVVEVEQWFDEKLQLPVWLDTNTEKYRTSIDPQTGHFSIAIPKVPTSADSKRQVVPVTPRVTTKQADKQKKQQAAQEESKEEKVTPPASSPKTTAAAAPTVAESIAPAPSTTSAKSTTGAKEATSTSTSSPSSKKRQSSRATAPLAAEQKAARRRVSPSPDVWAYVDDTSDLFDAFHPFHPRQVYPRAAPPARSYFSHPFINVSPFTSSFPFGW